MSNSKSCSFGDFDEEVASGETGFRRFFLTFEDATDFSFIEKSEFGESFPRKIGFEF